MNILLQLLALVILLVTGVSCSQPDSETSLQLLAAGRQPQLAVDNQGVVRVVFGLNDQIFCATSTDQGKTFSQPQLVDTLKGLYLGMSMGPQLASSANYSLVTAIDKKGNIHSYRLEHNSTKWRKVAAVNDIPGSVPESLMSVAADKADTFYAVWLDVRNTKQNKVVFASLAANAPEWSKNKVVYASPDSTVCECCKPSIAARGKQVTLMFRNWLNGSRDFYVTSSENNGQSFSPARKVGTGTWRLEGCPMDGGGIVLDNQNKLHTAWQREGNIYYARPGQQEVAIGKGRNCRISGTTQLVIAWQDEQNLKVHYLGSGKQETIGQGSYIETAEMPDKKTLCVWEKDKKIYFRKL